jgi:hypothetical protein
VQNALGKITTSVFDAASRRKASISSLGNRTSMVYDTASQVVAVQEGAVRPVPRFMRLSQRDADTQYGGAVPIDDDAIVQHGTRIRGRPKSVYESRAD